MFVICLKDSCNLEVRMVFNFVSVSSNWKKVCVIFYLFYLDSGYKDMFKFEKIHFAINLEWAFFVCILQSMKILKNKKINKIGYVKV